MKEKGFTLVELLAVIVVLAIVSLIAVPTVLNIISRVRLNALKDSAYGLVEAGTLYNAQYQNTKNVRFNIEDTKVSSNDTEDLLDFKGKVKKGTVIVNKQGKTTVCISDGTNSAYKNYNEQKVTLLKKKQCTIPENTYIVYLDDEKTISEYTPAELTDIVDDLTNEVKELKEQLNTKTTKKEVLDEVYPIGSIYTSTCKGTTETECLNTKEKVKAKFGGTWEAYGEGRVLVGIGNDSEFNSDGKTSGNKTITLDSKNLPSHSHTYTPSGSVSSTFSGSSATTSSTSKTLTGAFVIGPNVVTNTNNGALISGASGIMSRATSSANRSWTSASVSSSVSHYTTVNINATHTHNLTANGSVSSTFTGTQGTTSATGDGEAFSNLQPYITVYMWKRTA